MMFRGVLREAFMEIAPEKEMARLREGQLTSKWFGLNIKYFIYNGLHAGKATPVRFELLV